MKGDTLVAAGARYNGSRMIKRLAAAAYRPCCLTTCQAGGAWQPLSQLVVASLSVSSAIDAIMQAFEFRAVMHFASFIQVGESVGRPVKYFDHNVGNTLRLLDAMLLQM